MQAPTSVPQSSQPSLFAAGDTLGVAARIASDALRARGRSSLKCSLARLIVYAFGARPWVRISTREIRRRAAAWRITGWYGAPSYGLVVEVLEELEQLGYLTWQRAWIPRHHGRLTWEELAVIEEHTGETILYPHRSACGEPRAPARCLRVGPALEKLLAIASRAIPIRDARSSGDARPPRKAEASAARPQPLVVVSPSGCAPEAPATAADWRRAQIALGFLPPEPPE